MPQEIAVPWRNGPALLKALGLDLLDLITRVEIVIEADKPIILRTESYAKVEGMRRLHQTNR